MTEVIKYLEKIKEHQMQTVDLARSTEVYKLADKALKAIDVIHCSTQLPTDEEMFNEIGKRLIEKDDVQYTGIMKKPEDNGFVTGFRECFKWLKNKAIV